MKNIIKCSLFILVIGAASHSAWAHHENSACKPVHEACTKAGKKGKDAKSCVKTIKGGGTVEGVTVDPADVQACQASGKKSG